jgi:hypothetical protein
LIFLKKEKKLSGNTNLKKNIKSKVFFLFLKNQRASLKEEKEILFTLILQIVNNSEFKFINQMIEIYSTESTLPPSQRKPFFGFLTQIATKINEAIEGTLELKQIISLNCMFLVYNISLLI